MSDIILETPADTRRQGERLGRVLSEGDVVALTGTLGAGKTHFCQGIVAGLGASGAVTSPTFGLVHEYVGGRFPVFHFDFYRIESEEELIEIGWDEYLDRGGVVVVEWADRFEEAFPHHAQWWALRHDSSGSETGGRRLIRLR